MQCTKTPAHYALSSFRPTTDIMYDNDRETTPTCSFRTMTALVRANTAVGSRPETIFIRDRKSRVDRDRFSYCCLSLFVGLFRLSCVGYVSSIVRRSIGH